MQVQGSVILCAGTIRLVVQIFTEPAAEGAIVISTFSTSLHVFVFKWIQDA